MPLPPSSSIRYIITLIIVLSTFIGIIYLGEAGRLLHEQETSEAMKLSYLPSENTTKMISLGYYTFAADLLWIRCLQFSNHKSSTYSGPEKIAPYIDTLFALDPDFRYAYKWAGVTPLFMHQPAQIEDIELANRFLKMAMERYPNEYEWPYSIGNNYAFWTPATDPKLKQEMMTLGASYFERAMQFSGAPKELPILVASLLSGTSSDEEMFNFLEQAYLTAADPKIRKQIQDRLQNLNEEGNDRKNRLEQDQRRRERWKKQNYPYLNLGMFFALGNRHDFKIMTPTLPSSN